MGSVIKHESLDNIVYHELKRRIIDKEFYPGEKINQQQLTEDLNVSRTPLLTALKKLEQERLVDLIPRRGFYVRKITLEEMVAYYEVREVMEGLAARKAAQQISDEQIKKLRVFFTKLQISDEPEEMKKYAAEDRKFHTFVLKIADTELLSSVFNTFNILTISYQHTMRAGLVRVPSETIQEHRAIIEAICYRDPERAEELMKQHHLKSRIKLVREIANGTNTFQDTNPNHPVGSVIRS